MPLPFPPLLHQVCAWRPVVAPRTPRGDPGPSALEPDAQQQSQSTCHTRALRGPQGLSFGDRGKSFPSGEPRTRSSSEPQPLSPQERDPPALCEAHAPHYAPRPCKGFPKRSKKKKKKSFLFSQKAGPCNKRGTNKDFTIQIKSQGSNKEPLKYKKHVVPGVKFIAASQNEAKHRNMEKHRYF